MDNPLAWDSPFDTFGGGGGDVPSWLLGTDVALDIDFMGNRTWAANKQSTPGALLTVARAGTQATYMDSGGVVRKAAANTLRVDYDRKTGALLGVMVEDARTPLNGATCNLSDLTYWGVNGFAATVAKLSLIEGETAYNFQGDATPGRNRNFPFTGVAAANYTMVVVVEEDTSPAMGFGLRDDTASVWIGRANFTWATGLINTDAGALVSSKVTDLGTGPNGGRLRRLEATVLNGANTAVRFYVYPNSQEVGSPKTTMHYAEIEQASTGGSLQYVAAAGGVARPADDISILTSAFNFNALAGTIRVEATLDALPPSPVFAPMWSLRTPPSLNDRIDQYVRHTTGATRIFVRVGGITQSDHGLQSVVPGGVKVASAWAQNNIGISVNGASTDTDTLGDIPTPLGTLFIGGGGVGAGGYVNAHLKRLTHWPYRKIDAQLQALSS